MPRKNDLRSDIILATHKLRKERQEEQSDFWVENIRDNALRENCSQSGFSDRRSNLFLPATGQCTHAQIDQICCACKLHDFVSCWDFLHQTCQPESDGQEVNETSGGDTQSRSNASRASLPNATGDDVEHVRPRRNIECDRCGHKK